VVVSDLQGKRVLLLAPKFFGYDKDIRDEITRVGATVDSLPDRPFEMPFLRALASMHSSLVLPAADWLYTQMLEGFAAPHYDIILVVNGQTLSRKMLGLLRTSFPTAKTVLYMWDSIENRRGVLANLPLFDAAFSFDPESSRRHAMTLRPLFFSKGFERAPAATFDFHISFVGTMHSDRYNVLSRLRSKLPSELQTYWYLYLQAPWVYLCYRLAKPAMWRARSEEFAYAPLAKAELQSVFARSRSVLDIEHPLQRGLTMRTFEALGSHKKLITTNPHIRDCDFYRAENVSVIDRCAPRIPDDFLLTPFVPIDEAIYRRYSLSGWLDEILGVEREPRPRVATM
jgi:hypothetical protein